MDTAERIVKTESSGREDKYVGDKVDQKIHVHPMKLSCGGCGGPIRDKYLLGALGKYWHEYCLSCDFCHIPLAALGMRLYVKSEKKICRSDYLKLSQEANRCFGCNQPISSTELAFRLKMNVAFHLRCFCCSRCAREIRTGDQCAFNGREVMCSGGMCSQR